MIQHDDQAQFPGSERSQGPDRSIDFLNPVKQYLPASGSTCPPCEGGRSQERKSVGPEAVEAGNQLAAIKQVAKERQSRMSIGYIRISVGEPQHANLAHSDLHLGYARLVGRAGGDFYQAFTKPRRLNNERVELVIPPATSSTIPAMRQGDNR